MYSSTRSIPRHLELTGQLQAPIASPTGKWEPEWAPRAVWTLERKFLSPLPGIEPYFLSRPAHSLVTAQCTLAQLLWNRNLNNLPNTASRLLIQNHYEIVGILGVLTQGPVTTTCWRSQLLSFELACNVTSDRDATPSIRSSDWSTQNTWYGFTQQNSSIHIILRLFSDLRGSKFYVNFVVYIVYWTLNPIILETELLLMLLG